MIHVGNLEILLMYKYHPKGFQPYIFKIKNSYNWNSLSPSSIGYGCLIFLWLKCLVQEKGKCLYIFLQSRIPLVPFFFNLNGMFICLFCCIRMGERGLDIPSTRYDVKMLQIKNSLGENNNLWNIGSGQNIKTFKATFLCQIGNISEVRG